MFDKKKYYAKKLADGLDSEDRFADRTDQTGRNLFRTQRRINDRYYRTYKSVIKPTI